MPRFEGFEQVSNPALSPIPYRVPSARPKFVWHTDEIEGPATLADVKRWESTHPTPPHFWVDPIGEHAVQGGDTDSPSQALAHPRGTPETNHAWAIQVELHLHAKDTASVPTSALDYLAELFAPVFAHHEIDPLVWLLSGDLAHLAPRVGPGQPFYDLGGHLGHQRCPTQNQLDPSDNITGHWDPGPLRIDVIGQRIAAINTPEDDMTPAQEAKLDRALQILEPGSPLRDQLLAIEHNQAVILGRLPEKGSWYDGVAKRLQSIQKKLGIE